ncbi:hypothetical protein [Stenotrophomonas tumulicola]|uniref:Uncharacterized protein n=1 Tax=Stenotrophomonas tumulicola TaxID=1685415 RepID=A0A7W3FJP9_9GAMM|nr:hypothetical protein [Stenotrophomonas tumulicola]MBA8680517.1 hypothetical protein [Stenotrophomonas tumulicola]
MPIEVDLPDGSIAEFPDGMPDAEINAVLQRQFGGGQAPVTDMPAVQALPPDFSGVTASVDSTASDRQADGWKAGIGRDLAFGARSALQGAGSLLGAFGGDALGALETNVTGRPVSSFRDNAARLADVLGLPQAQTAGDRVLGDIGEALTGTALSLGGGAALSGGRAAAPTIANAAPAPTAVPGIAERAGEFLTAQPLLQVLSTIGSAGAAGTARENGAGGGGQLAAALAGGIGPAALAQGGAAALRGAVRGRSGDAMRNTIADFEALGTTPSVGQASGNSNLVGVENLLAGAPTSSGVMQRFAQGQGDDIAQNLAGRSRALAPDPTRQNAGTAIESGVASFKGDVTARRRALYDAVDQLVQSDAPVRLDRTRAELTRLTTPDPGAPSSSGSLIPDEVNQLARNIAADLGETGDSLPYQTFKDLRSNLGNGLFDFSLTPDKATTQLRGVYRAMGDDIEAAVAAQGGQAPAALARANAYFKSTQEQLKQLERVVNKNGGPEKVYNAVMAGAGEGGTTLKRVMEALPDDGKKSLTAAVLNRMGRPTPGQAGLPAEQFSPGTFMTNWSKLSNEARAELFGHYGPGFAKDMDQIARVADNIKSGASFFANPSGTANRAAAYTYGAALVASMMDVTGTTTSQLLGAGLAANGGARLLTSPRFVKWLARATTAPKGSVAGSLSSLRNIATSSNDGELEDIAEQLRKAQQEADGADNED